MKNYFIAGFFFAGMILASCGAKDEQKDTTPKVQPQKIGELKIAFYNQDSLKEHFEFYKEQDSIVTKKQLAFQKKMENDARQLELDYKNYMTKAQAGEYSAEQMQGFEGNLQKRQIELQRYQETEGAKLEQETLKKLEEIGRKIEIYSEKYCKEHGIDILMIQAKGGQFNYIHPRMDVTEEFTEFLNQNEEEIEKEIKNTTSKKK